jgi:hypothetical protein
LRTELVWDGKYDEFGNRREVDFAACAFPTQKIEAVDEPRQRAAAQAQTDMFEQRLLRIRESAPDYKTTKDFRKRLIELQRALHAEGKPYRAFDVYNLGRYERQWWQKDRLKGAEEEHRRVVLEFFKAEILSAPPSSLLHGRKAGAFCHVDGIDSPP